MKNKIEKLYLTYFNDFCSIQCFSEYCNTTIKNAKRIIKIGRELNHRRYKNV